MNLSEQLAELLEVQRGIVSRLPPSSQDWERTVAADSVFAEHGITVLAVTPTGFRRDRRGFRERVERAYLNARATGRRPTVRMAPRGGGVYG